jgi:hypothetical protein
MVSAVMASRQFFKIWYFLTLYHLSVHPKLIQYLIKYISKLNGHKERPNERDRQKAGCHVRLSLPCHLPSIRLSRLSTFKLFRQRLATADSTDQLADGAGSGTVEELKTRIKDYIADPSNANIAENSRFTALFHAKGKARAALPPKPSSKARSPTPTLSATPIAGPSSGQLFNIYPYPPHGTYNNFSQLHYANPSSSSSVNNHHPTSTYFSNPVIDSNNHYYHHYFPNH